MVSVNSFLISIIVPVYNASRYLDRCINSIIKQTYQRWELLIIDDGSTDDSYKIAMKFSRDDCRIKVFHQNNLGAGAARNIGIKVAKGDYVVFVDSDDKIKPEYLSLLAAHNEDVVFIDVENMSEKGKVLSYLKMSKKSHLSQETILRYQMTSKLPWGGWRKCVKTTLLHDNGIQYSTNIVGEEAVYSFMLLYYAKSIGFINQPVYSYIQRASSLSHSIIEDPYGEVVKSLKQIIASLGEYSKYKNTIRAFQLTSSAINANCIAKYNSYNIYKYKIRKCYENLLNEQDNDCAVDYKSMSLKSIILSKMLIHKMYIPIWLASRCYRIFHKF